MKKIQKSLSVLLLAILLANNTLPICAAEKMQLIKTDGLADSGDADGYEIQPFALAPATNLQLYIYSVSSEKAGEEIIGPSGSTTLDHGGTWLRITTIESGYAKSRSATINGEMMALIDKQVIDTNNDGIIDECMCIWEYKNSEGVKLGMFRVILTSANSPWNAVDYTFYIN